MRVCYGLFLFCLKKIGGWFYAVLCNNIDTDIVKHTLLSYAIKYISAHIATAYSQLVWIRHLERESSAARCWRSLTLLARTGSWVILRLAVLQGLFTWCFLPVLSLSISIYVYLHLYLRWYVYMFIYIYTYIYMYIHVYIYIYVCLTGSCILASFLKQLVANSPLIWHSMCLLYSLHRHSSYRPSFASIWKQLWSASVFRNWRWPWWRSKP